MSVHTGRRWNSFNAGGGQAQNGQTFDRQNPKECGGETVICIQIIVEKVGEIVREDHVNLNLLRQIKERWHQERGESKYSNVRVMNLEEYGRVAVKRSTESTIEEEFETLQRAYGRCSEYVVKPHRLVYDESEGAYYLIMETMENARSLHHMLQEVRLDQQKKQDLITHTLPPILSLLGSALGNLHEAGIYHGDLNSANILVEERGNAMGERKFSILIIDGGKMEIKDRPLSERESIQDLQRIFSDLRTWLNIGEQQLKEQLNEFFTEYNRVRKGRELSQESVSFRERFDTETIQALIRQFHYEPDHPNKDPHNDSPSRTSPHRTEEHGVPAHRFYRREGD